MMQALFVTFALTALVVLFVLAAEVAVRRDNLLGLVALASVVVAAAASYAIEFSVMPTLMMLVASTFVINEANAERASAQAEVIHD